MAEVDVKTLLNPLGPAVKEAVQGARNEGRVAVAVHWTEIQAALDAGLTIAAIYRVLSKAGLVGVTVRSFTRQVKARREGKRVSQAVGSMAGAAPAKPSATAEGALRPDASTIDGLDSPAAPQRRPAGPRRPWRTGPREAPDPNAVFRPRDPLADE